MLPGMPHTVVITGPIADPSVDATLALIRAALAAGHRVDVCDTSALRPAAGGVTALVHPVLAAHLDLSLGPERSLALAAADIVAYRCARSFGPDEAEAAQLLARLRGRVRFLSDPRSLLEAGIRPYARRFREHAPSYDPEGPRKRVLLLGGSVLGAFEPGREARPAVLNRQERRLAATVGVSCRRDGLGLVGLDLAGEHLLAVEVTAPSGLRELERLEQGAPAATVIRWLAAQRPGDSRDRAAPAVST
jgi:hypothetical protein